MGIIERTAITKKPHWLAARFVSQHLFGHQCPQYRCATYFIFFRSRHIYNYGQAPSAALTVGRPIEFIVIVRRGTDLPEFCIE